MKWDVDMMHCIWHKSMADIHKKNKTHMTGVMKNTLKQKTMKPSAFAHTTHSPLPVHGLAHWMAKT